MTTLFNGLVKNDVKKEDFSNLVMFDPKKLRSLLQYFLRFLIQLNITEVSYLYSVQTNPIHWKHDYIQKIQGSID
jgi:hypothetical protein